jgi:mannose-6-phosphate isomerase-like protein (cupin superfamily)
LLEPRIAADFAPERTMHHMTAQGDGWAIATLDDMGEGPGFRKVRSALGVEAFGVNAIVLPEGHDTGTHLHDRQDELYFVHEGTIEITLGDEAPQTLAAGGFAHVTAPVPRSVRNPGPGEAVYVIVGGKDGYVGRDGRKPE